MHASLTPQEAMVRRIGEICPSERPFGGITVEGHKIVVGRVQRTQRNDDEAAPEDTLVAVFNSGNKLLAWAKLDVESGKLQGSNRLLVENLLQSRERSTPIRGTELTELGRVIKRDIPYHLLGKPQLEPTPEQLDAMARQLHGHTFAVNSDWKDKDPRQPQDAKLPDGTELWAHLLPDRDSADPKFTLHLQFSDGKSNPGEVAIDNLVVTVMDSNGVAAAITRVDGSSQLDISDIKIGVEYTMHCAVLPATVPIVPQL